MTSIRKRVYDLERYLERHGYLVVDRRTLGEIFPEETLRAMARSMAEMEENGLDMSQYRVRGPNDDDDDEDEIIEWDELMKRLDETDPRRR